MKPFRNRNSSFHCGRLSQSRSRRAFAGDCGRLVGIGEKPLPPGERRHLVETVFRAAHSLKGASRAVNFAEVESICQSLENVFAVWMRRQEGVPSPQEMDRLHRWLDAATEILNAPESAHDADGQTLPPSRPQAAALLLSPEQPARVETAPAETPPSFPVGRN